MIRAFAPVVACAFAAAALAAPPERGIFELDTEKPAHAVLTVAEALPPGSTPPPAPNLTSPMLMNLGGVVASLTGPQVNLLAATVRPNAKPPEVTAEFRRTCVVHLCDRAGKAERRVEILTGPEGVTVAREHQAGSGKPGPGPAARAAQLDAEKYRQLSIGWARYRGPFEAGAPGLSDSVAQPLPASAEPSVAELAKPVLHPPLYLDERTFSDRFLSGGQARPLKPVRVLGQEKFFLRTPAKYDPAKPIGLLVWINAGPDGRVPETFAKGADELGIACVGVENAGNDRPVVDRFQLALDTLFAASERIHVDPRRVYITGISGGGRTSTRLACCFPDYFTGAAPIVGLSAYFDVPLGNGKRSPAGFDKPSAARFALLRTRRIGVTTGDKDFNHNEIVAAAKRMNDDRLQVKVFDHEGFGHQMPSPDQFTEVLKWVDQPYQDTVAKEAQGAQTILDAYIQKWGDVPPPAKDAKARAELVKVTQAGPWTPAAWHAAKLLR